MAWPILGCPLPPDIQRMLDHLGPTGSHELGLLSNFDLWIPTGGEGLNPRGPRHGCIRKGGGGARRRPQQRLDRRLEEVAKAVGGGYCRLQMPLSLALAARDTVAGHRLGALERGGGGVTSLPLPTHPRTQALSDLAQGPPPTPGRGGGKVVS